MQGTQENTACIFRPDPDNPTSFKRYAMKGEDGADMQGSFSSLKILTGKTPEDDKYVLCYKSTDGNSKSVNIYNNNGDLEHSIRADGAEITPISGTEFYFLDENENVMHVVKKDDDWASEKVIEGATLKSETNLGEFSHFRTFMTRVGENELLITVQSGKAALLKVDGASGGFNLETVTSLGLADSEFVTEIRPYIDDPNTLVVATYNNRDNARPKKLYSLAVSLESIFGGPGGETKEG